MNISALKARIRASKEDLYPLPLEQIVVAEGALHEAAAFIAKQAESGVVLVADSHTYKAAGSDLHDHLCQKGVKADWHLLEPNNNGDIIADEASLISVMLKVEQSTKLLVAVGAGTIHDIVRFVSGKTNKPFVSIPTAPSVDGFTSLGAPIVVQGSKKTYQLVAPIALFADMVVLQHAPPALIAAGFGDMVGKYTSLFDWKIGALLKNEAYSELVADLTAEALSASVDKVADIGKRTTAGVQVLMESLLTSGLAMALFGYSHPASGAEHHLSHYWEMEALRLGKKQLLHGAKVGLSTQIINRFYKNTVLPDVHRFLGDDEAKQVIALVEALPDPDDVKALLEQAGWSEALVPIAPELVEESLQHAYLLRDRYTLLRLYREGTTMKKEGEAHVGRS
ncbi:hypothetical protein CHH54_06440 [Bacillus sp. 7520-S]|nr:hypothetical protein CHH54_06440 [Bacillus sp. 7520-S]